MKHPDEYAWELVHGLQDGDAHRDYIENAGYKDHHEYVITRDGLRYVEKFIRKIMFDTCDYTVNKTVKTLGIK